MNTRMTTREIREEGVRFFEEVAQPLLDECKVIVVSYIQTMELTRWDRLEVSLRSKMPGWEGRIYKCLLSFELFELLDWRSDPGALTPARQPGAEGLISMRTHAALRSMEAGMLAELRRLQELEMRT